MHDPDELLILCAKMDKPRENYLKMKSICDRYDRGKNSVLSRVVSRLKEVQGSPKGIEAIKTLAYGDSEYTQYLKDWRAAEKLKVEAQIEFENLESRFAAFQSVIAWERESIKKNMA